MSPLQRCTNAGQRGWRWDALGYCYIYGGESGVTEANARRKAQLESLAATPFVETRRVTQRGRVDPNAAAKDKSEAVLQDVLAGILTLHFGELLGLLGSPPDWRAVPTSLWTRWEQELAQEIRPSIRQGALAAAEQLILVQDYPVEIGRADVKTQRWAGMRSLTWAAVFTLATRKATWERVARGVAEPDRDLATDLSSYFSAVRAQTEAATETTRAFIQGERLVVDDLPAPLQSPAIWRTMRDGAVCDICGPRDDRPETEWSGFPPSPHYQCRCWVTYANIGAPLLVGELPGREISYTERLLL